MRCWMLAAVTGALVVPLMPDLPSTDSIYLTGWIALILAICSCVSRLPGLRPAAGLMAGLFWACLNAGQNISTRLPFELEGKTLEVEGWVVSLPEQTERGWKFRFRPEPVNPELVNVDRKHIEPEYEDPINSGLRDSFSSGDLLLSWYGEQKIQAGEQWRFKVRLTRPHGSVNPGLFDYEGWLFQQGISAVGYVRSNQGQRLGRSLWVAPHHQLRGWLRATLLVHLKASDVKGLIIALVIGENAQISSAQWQVLSATGTNHLLIISGLHVGLIAAGCFFLLQRLGAGLRRSLAFSLVLAFCYGAVAGFGLPVQRALFMTGMALSGLMLARHTHLFNLFLFSLFGVLLIEPFSSLSAGFWLSFGAVFVLLYSFSSRYQAITPDLQLTTIQPMPFFTLDGAQHSLVHYLKQLILSQWVMMIGLFPFLLQNVAQFSMVSMGANLIALPWVSLLTIPVLLMSALMFWVYEPLGIYLLKLSEWLMSTLWSILAWTADLGWVYYPTAFSLPEVVLAVAGSLLSLSPKGLRVRWLGPFLLLPILFPDQPQLAYGEVRVTVLDVGQGLSVMIRTRDHRLVYDAGPRFSDRFDAGERIVLPAIRRQSRNPLDVMVISHGDMDHAGGAEAVVRGHWVREIWRSKFYPQLFDPESEKKEVRETKDCSQASQWNWDGVDFELFRLVDQNNQNNESCVLTTQAGHQRLTIPGDIEVGAEKQLVRQQLIRQQQIKQKGVTAGKANQTKVLIAPHHGSKTSSSPGFLNTVKPDWVIISAGYLNRFGHPHPQVLQRYKVRHINYLNTAESGAIEIILGGEDEISIQTARNISRRLWYD